MLEENLTQKEQEEESKFQEELDNSEDDSDEE